MKTTHTRNKKKHSKNFLITVRRQTGEFHSSFSPSYNFPLLSILDRMGSYTIRTQRNSLTEVLKKIKIGAFIREEVRNIKKKLLFCSFG